MGVPAPLGVIASGRSPYWPVEGSGASSANAVVQGTLEAVGPSPPFPFYGTINLAIWVQYETSLDTADGDLTVVVGALGQIAVGSSVSSPLLPRGTTIGSIAGSPSLEVVLPTYTYWGNVLDGIAAITDIPETDYLLGSTVAGFGVPDGTTVTAITTPSVQGNENVPTVRGVVELSDEVTEQPPNTRPNPYTFALDDGIIATGTDTAAIFTGAGIGLVGTIQVEFSFDGGLTWLVGNIGGSGMLAQFSTTTPVFVSFGMPERNVLMRLNLTALTGVAGKTVNYRMSATGQAATTLAVQTL